MLNNLGEDILALEKLGIIKVLDRKKLKIHVYNFACFSWHIDDVKHVDSNMRERYGNHSKAPLTDEECRQVLSVLEHNHDATIGINWDVIQSQIENLGL